MTLEINNVYNFNTRAPSILGTSIKNAKLVNVLDYETALAFDNVDLKYRTIYPLLPAGTPDQPDSNLYYRFISESGEKIIIADQWIDETSVEVVGFINLQLTLTQVSNQDISRVRDLLNAAGYTNFIIKTL